MIPEPFPEKDFLAIGTAALTLAQFGFAFAPLSVNEYLVPGFTGDRKPTMIMSHAAHKFKMDIARSIDSQKRRPSSRAYEWQCHPRYFSFWVILRKDHKTCERIDTDNSHKLIQDAFVRAEVIPDDRYCRDSRQLYGDFEAAGLPDHFSWATLVQWGAIHPAPNVRVERKGLC